MHKATVIAEIVNSEIREVGTPRWGGRPFEKCLTAPRKIICQDHNGNDLEGVWVVFEEIKDGKSGYSVVYLEKDGVFGLAVPAKLDGLILIGLCGNFLETLCAM